MPDARSTRWATSALVDLQRPRGDQDGQATRPGPDDVIVTVATDGAAHVRQERAKTVARATSAAASATVEAAECSAVTSLGSTPTLIECTERDRHRIFNLGYYTWVEQQGVALEVFEARRARRSGRGCGRSSPVWDALIDEFNARRWRRLVITRCYRLVCAGCGAVAHRRRPARGGAPMPTRRADQCCCASETGGASVAVDDDAPEPVRQPTAG